MPADYLPHRVAAVTVEADTRPLEVVGVYVPSRDRTEAKVTRKRTFLRGWPPRSPPGRLVTAWSSGGFNILEPTHVPRYRTFQAWEYGFCTGLATAGYRDAFRLLAADVLECSWVGRTGDGYRYGPRPRLRAPHAT